MRWLLFGASALAALAVGIGVAEIQSRFASASKHAPKDDPLFKAYVLSLFSEPGRAADEFATLSSASPLLTSYAVALFTAERCSTPKPSEALERAAGGVAAFETEVGKKIFAVAGVVSTMKFPSAESEAAFCEATRKAIALSEATTNTP
jgi:hypothetical protein